MKSKSAKLSRSSSKSAPFGRPTPGKPGKLDRPSEPASASTKKGFNLARDSVYVADPITELRICGGRGVLPPEEAGDLDTDPGPGVPVQDQRRLAKPVPPQTLRSIHQDGVLQPIVIGKIDDVATVIVGKRRVRAARASNRRRLQEGRPLLRLRCVIQRDVRPVAVKAAIIRENSHREEDDLADKIGKLRAYLGDGGSESDAAREFNVEQDTVRGWLDYDDHATDDLKTAVQAGLPASTAMEIAKVHDADRQRALLARVLATPGARQRSARKVRAIARGEDERPVLTSRRDQRALLREISRVDPGADESFRREYWRGVQHALIVVTGATGLGEVDPDLCRAVERARPAAAVTSAAPQAEGDEGDEGGDDRDGGDGDDGE